MSSIISLASFSFKCLESIQSTRFQILAYSFVFSLDSPIRNYFNQNYANRTLVERNERPSAGLETSRGFKTSCERSSNQFDIGLRGVARAPIWFRAFRGFTTIWLTYVVLRYLLGDQLDRVAARLLALDRPLHCYLLGRYILDENVADMTAFVFASAHLAWRLAQALLKPYKIGAFYFLILSSHDLELIYSKLGDGQSANQCLELTLRESDELSRRDQFVLDTFCYRSIEPTRIVFRLRANRTRAAHRELRRLLARLTLVCTLLVAPTACLITLAFLLLGLTDRRYTGAYPNCEPHLQRLRDSGQLGAWSMSFTWHKFYSLVGDIFENVSIWLESGLVTTVGPAAAYLLNYDLTMHWRGIKQKLEALRASAARVRWEPLAGPPAAVLERATIIGRSNDQHSQQIKQLISEINDYFQQISVADKSITHYLSGVLFGGLALCCTYTYFTRVRCIDRLPPGLTAVLIWLLVAIAVSCHGSLMVHRFCWRSYPAICSLMAHDHLKREHNFGTILEFYATRRTCFKLLNQFPFMPTTFLTIVGWGFSCFCIISSMLDRRPPALQAPP